MDKKEATQPESIQPRQTQRPQFALQTLLALPVFVAALCAVGVSFDWYSAGALLPIPVGFVLWRCGILSLKASATIVGFGLLVAMVIPALDFMPRTPGNRAVCRSRLSQLGKALLQYETTYGRFPQPYTTNNDGYPLVSWRASILPFLEHQDLHRKCRFEEPWNSPTNAKLARIDLRFMRCPSDRLANSGETSYLAVIGPGTIWSVDEPISLDEIDDPSRTIMLVEVAGSGISWLEPRDLSLAEALRGINAESKPCISSGHPGCVNVLFADGHIETLPNSLDVNELEDLLTIGKCLEGKPDEPP